MPIGICGYHKSLSKSQIKARQPKNPKIYANVALYFSAVFTDHNNKKTQKNMNRMKTQVCDISLTHYTVFQSIKLHDVQYMTDSDNGHNDITARQHDQRNIKSNTITDILILP